MSVPASRRALVLRRRPAVAPRLVERLATPEALRDAWRQVRRNGGGAGGDGVTLAVFEAGLDEALRQLGQALRAGDYRPGPLRHVDIPKPDGRVRRLSIPCIRDRVAQSAALALLQARLDGRMSATSFGYRPALGVADALAAVTAGRKDGLGWTWEADIRAFFDSVPHRRLLAELAIWIEADDMLQLIGGWLRGFSCTGMGVAQGAPISPLLANLYLHPLDRLLAAAGHRPVRYADDFVVLARSCAAAGEARDLGTQVLRDRGLAVQPAKTRIVPPECGFDFLGVPIAPALARA